MKLDNSKSNFLRSAPTSQTLKKQTTLQREAAKKYSQFKKSASQPAYFLNKSRLKKISDIYRAISLQKLARNNSLHKSKSLHNSVTPQKKNSFYNNHTFKKPPCLNTINMNRALQTTQKTKRLKLNSRAQQNPSSTHINMNNSVQSINMNGTKFLLKQIERLQEISSMSIQKAFIGQYEDFFKTIRNDNLFGRVGTLNQMKYLLSKFCNLLYVCQQRIRKINEKSIKARYDKVQINFSNTNAQLKKKTFKMELLIKQINQLKDHNMKLAQQLSDLKTKNKNSNNFNDNNYLNGEKTINKINQQVNRSKKRISTFQINNMFQLKINRSQAEMKTPLYHQLTFQSNKSISNKNQSQESDSAINYFYKNQGNHQNPINNNNAQQNKKNFQNQNYFQKNNQADKLNQKNKPQPNQKLQMIKHIRSLQKKQKQLIKTLLILKSDGIDVQRAFNEVISGHQNIDIDQSTLHLPKNKMPSYVKKIKNKDTYEADSSIIDSIDGLTVRYFEGECEQDYVFYPIKNEYKSKPLNRQMQDRLRLNFNALYEQDDYYNEQNEEQYKNKDPPTI